ncbi:MAG: aspartate aminotransferase family protein [Candidatus Marinimicrobia bacterium]|nr:aspartate aminotransferase family protein [Candidatus Neomarinimicrobiota bacterium]MCF7921677.1 aspartate aminotransferase family protein [Candidatus Neomarinimicrobiota bacterium]
MKTLPSQGKNHTDILEEMRQYGGQDVNYRQARTWSLVYHLDEEHTEFLKQAYGLYFSENALNPMAFQSLKRFETDVINMTAHLLHGDEQAVGTLTSGGTESCLLPVLTYRDLAKANRRFPFKPEMIAPESIHVAWSKAAKYFGVKIRYAPLKQDFRVDIAAVKKMINRRTIMLVGSAPSYPHGVIDPIGELGLLAQQHKLPLHVDACLGGFLLPFIEMNGGGVPLFDFRIPGVTSISADVHKYGFAAKGASTVIYRDMKYMKHQFFIHEDWPGGVFASPALLGTRPGGAFAAAWAAMHALGENGYRENAQKIMDITSKLQRGINAIDGLQILGHPDMSVFAYHSIDDGINIFAVGDQMEARGWQIDRLQRPEGLHVMVVPEHAKITDEYISDLTASVELVKSNPKLAAKGNAAMYGMIANLPFRGMIKKEVMKMMKGMYSSQGQMPMDGSKNPWLVEKVAGFMQRRKSKKSQG